MVTVFTYIIANRHVDICAGHREAWTKAKILHQDLSDGNVLILINQESADDDNRGMLIDWDLCKYKEDMREGATQGGRTVSALPDLSLFWC